MVQNLSQKTTYFKPRSPAYIWGLPHLSLDLRFAETEFPLQQERNIKSIHMKNSPLSSWGIIRETLLPCLTVVGTTNNVALALDTRIPATPQRERWLVLIHLWKNSPEISRFPSRLKFHWFRWLGCGFRYLHVYSDEWNCNFPCWMSYSGMKSRASCLVEEKREVTKESIKYDSSSKVYKIRNFYCGSIVTNLTSIHEDTSLIPDPAQWVKDPRLPWVV